MTGEAGRIGSGEGEAPGREAFQLGSSSEALGHGGTGRNSPVQLIFLAVHRAGQSSSPCPHGEEESHRNQIPPHAAGFLGTFFFKIILLIVLTRKTFT